MKNEYLFLGGIKHGELICVDDKLDSVQFNDESNRKVEMQRPGIYNDYYERVVYIKKRMIDVDGNFVNIFALSTLDYGQIDKMLKEANAHKDSYGYAFKSEEIECMMRWHSLIEKYNFKFLGFKDNLIRNNLFKISYLNEDLFEECPVHISSKDIDVIREWYCSVYDVKPEKLSIVDYITYGKICGILVSINKGKKL